MFFTVLFTIAKLLKKPRCPTIDNWIKRPWYTYAMEYYSVIKKNEILPFMTAWMDLKGIRDIFIICKLVSKKAAARWWVVPTGAQLLWHLVIEHP